jgi:hypothetical protein
VSSLKVSACFLATRVWSVGSVHDASALNQPIRESSDPGSLGDQGRATLASEIRPEPLALRAQALLPMRQGENMWTSAHTRNVVKKMHAFRGAKRQAIGARSFQKCLKTKRSWWARQRDSATARQRSNLRHLPCQGSPRHQFSCEIKTKRPVEVQIGA